MAICHSNFYHFWAPFASWSKSLSIMFSGKVHSRSSFPLDYFAFLLLEGKCRTRFCHLERVNRYQRNKQYLRITSKYFIPKYLKNDYTNALPCLLQNVIKFARNNKTLQCPWKCYKFENNISQTNNIQNINSNVQLHFYYN